MNSIDLGGRARRSWFGGWWFDLTHVHVVNRPQSVKNPSATVKYPRGDYLMGDHPVALDGRAVHAWIPRGRMREFARVGWERA